MGLALTKSKKWFKKNKINKIKTFKKKYIHYTFPLSIHFEISIPLDANNFAT